MRRAPLKSASQRNETNRLEPRLDESPFHTLDEVDALRELFHDVPLRLNLIDVNDARPDGFRRATDDELSRFRDELRTLGIPIVRRYSGGAAKHAACGMLASLRVIPLNWRIAPLASF